MQIEVARKVTTLTFLLLAGIGIAAAQQTPSPSGAPPATQNYLSVTSTAFSADAAIPPKYTCAASPNAPSPPLEWSGAPKNTASFVLILHDLEARPNKSAFEPIHWIVWNIPADSHGLPEGVPPDGQLSDGTRQGNNADKKIGFKGPCPRAPILHHYMFDLFALDQKLDLPPGATRDDVVKAIDGHVVGHGILMSTFRQ